MPNFETINLNDHMTDQHATKTNQCIESKRLWGYAYHCMKSSIDGERRVQS